MKKKIAAALLGAMMLCGNAFAMQFEQPEKIGSVSAPPAGGFDIEGASNNKGDLYKKNNKRIGRTNLYGKGIAQFSKKDTALYFHYDFYQYFNRSDPKNMFRYAARFGGEDKRNTFPITQTLWESSCTIKQIKNDENRILYLLTTSGPVAGTQNYILLGRKNDGTFVKYFDMEDINKGYFGRTENNYGTTLGKSAPYYQKCRCEDDTIIIEYQLFVPKQGHYKAGEFRFRWDDAAQWFGVEQVVY